MTKQTKRQSESGNVLFLILIAVALFAALSYVVTQSTRSGGGSTDREKSVLNSAQMTQYPTTLRTAVIRMVLAGTNVEKIVFNDPATFGTIPPGQLLFQTPQGGSASYQTPSTELSTDGSQLLWKFNSNLEVPEIGTAGINGNDLIAFLPGISTGVCFQVNKQLGVNSTGCTMHGDIPQSLATVLAADYNVSTVAAVGTPWAITEPMSLTTDLPDLQCAGGGTAFTRQASGCFYNLAADQNVFYSVLLER